MRTVQSRVAGPLKRGGGRNYNESKNARMHRSIQRTNHQPSLANAPAWASLSTPDNAAGAAPRSRLDNRYHNVCYHNMLTLCANDMSERNLVWSCPQAIRLYPPRKRRQTVDRFVFFGFLNERTCLKGDDPTILPNAFARRACFTRAITYEISRASHHFSLLL